MVSAPKVNPGDAVFWHCDVIHAVDIKNNGSGDSAGKNLSPPLTPCSYANAWKKNNQWFTFLLFLWRLKTKSILIDRKQIFYVERRPLISQRAKANWLLWVWRLLTTLVGLGGGQWAYKKLSRVQTWRFLSLPFNLLVTILLQILVKKHVSFTIKPNHWHSTHGVFCRHLKVCNNA